MKMACRSTIVAALVLVASGFTTGIATAAPARTVALGGGALTASWDATGSGALLTADLMDATGCQPGVHDCDDTLIKAAEAGTLTVKTSSTDPAAVDTDLHLFASNAQGEVGDELQGSAGSTPEEVVSARVKEGGYYLARIDFAASAEGAVQAEAALKPTPPPAPGPKPFDYTKVGGLSQPVFTDIERTSVEVPGADGINLYIEVIKPKGGGRYPVILEASGYHGTLYKRDGIRILPVPKGPDGESLGLAGYFPPRGYAVVMMDLRGTGRSEGCLDHLGSNDLSDIKTVIEWAASRPWSNGRVGMTGHSYVGGTTNLGGATGAKGLATIVPSASLASMYDHQFQAGVPYNLQWAGPIEAYEQLALQADLPPQLSPVTEAAGNGPTGDNFGNDPEYTGCGLPNSAAVAGEDQLSGRFNEEYHGARDHREAVKKARIPIFLQHGTIDAAARIGGVEWFFERGLRPGDKLWIGQWGHGIGCCPTRRGLQWTYALHAWFDKQLARRPVKTGPPVEVFLNDEPTDEEAEVGQGSILAGARMPRTRPYVLHAEGDEGLAEKRGEPGTADFVGDPLGFSSTTRAPAARPSRASRSPRTGCSSACRGWRCRRRSRFRGCISSQRCSRSPRTAAAGV